MQQLLGGKAPLYSSLLRALFLQWLPSTVQMILASANEMSIDKLGEMADRILDLATPIVSAVSAFTGEDAIRKLICKKVNTTLQAQQRSHP